MNKQIDVKSLSRSVGKDKAIELSNTKWWEGKDHQEIAYCQFFTEELIMPFDLFHKAVEKTLSHPVFTHEFGVNWNGIAEELIKVIPSKNQVMVDILQ